MRITIISGPIGSGKTTVAMGILALHGVPESVINQLVSLGGNTGVKPVGNAVYCEYDAASAPRADVFWGAIRKATRRALEGAVCSPNAEIKDLIICISGKPEAFVIPPDFLQFRRRLVVLSDWVTGAAIDPSV